MENLKEYINLVEQPLLLQDCLFLACVIVILQNHKECTWLLFGKIIIHFRKDYYMSDVGISIYLFTKPGKMLNQGEIVNASDIMDLSREVTSRLKIAAEIMRKLEQADWECTMEDETVICQHPDIISWEDVEDTLLRLNIDSDNVDIVDLNDNEEHELEQEYRELGGEG